MREKFDFYCTALEKAYIEMKMNYMQLLERVKMELEDCLSKDFNSQFSINEIEMILANKPKIVKLDDAFSRI